MASKKISQLTPATTPLTGTEQLPIVQNGVTVKVSASDVSALFAAPLVVDANGTIGDISGIQYGINLAGFPPVFNGPTTIQAKLLPSINLNVNNGFTATYVDFSGPSEYGSFSVSNITTPLTSVSCSAEHIYSSLSLANNNNLTSISFPNLKNVSGNMEIGGYPFSVTYNFSSLESVANAQGSLTIGAGSGISVLDNSIFPVLKRTSFNILDVNTTSVNLPSLQYLGYITINYLVDVYLPNVIECASTYLASFSPSPSGVFIVGTVGITKKWGDGISNPAVDMTSAGLNQASVDNFLTVLASLDGTNGTTSCDNGFMYLAGTNAAPSPAGLAAKTVLQGRGWDVQTN